MHMETFGIKAVVTLTGLTYRQVDHWARTGIVIPFKAGAGKGTRREYTFNDLVALRVARKFKEEDGISLQKIRKALAYLRKNFPDLRQPLAEMRLVTDGDTLFLVERDIDREQEKIIDALKQGQQVFSVLIGKIIEDLQGKVRQLATPKETKVQLGGRPYTITLIPDLEDGVHIAQCKESPIAVSKGETEQEAIENIIEGLEEHLKRLNG
jgi:DNA-binding transcriptional MerR regulator/predicted RNase H-like HicB family nuclease